jgi:CHAD domain-containing protein
VSAWRFQPGEKIDAAFRRLAHGGIEEARAALARPDGDLERAVHKARRSLKKLRALLRLARPSLGPAYAPQNARLRDAGRALSGARDAAVLRQSFDRLVQECHAGQPDEHLDTLRRSLSDGADDHAVTPETLQAVLAALADAAGEVDALPWPNGARSLARGLAAGQARLRKSLDVARAKPTPDNLHDWRKRLKDQAPQLGLLQAGLDRSLKARRKREQELAKILGEEHDLCLLGARLADMTVQDGAAETRDRLAAEVEARRKHLRATAFRRGRSLAEPSPKRFAAALLAARKRLA